MSKVRILSPRPEIIIDVCLAHVYFLYPRVLRGCGRCFLICANGCVFVDAKSLGALRGINGTSGTYDAATGTWQVFFPYGTVSGIAACSNVESQNTETGIWAGYVADDQYAIAEEGGRYCCCKMTEPYISASPWVFYRRFASRCNSDCASLCAGYNVRTSVPYRLSLFLGGWP